VNSHLTDDFIKLFKKLPDRIQRLARVSYRQWKENPYQPNLQFKKVHSLKPIYSVRVSLGWRALGFKEGNTVLWFWIGSHESYNKIVAQF